MKTLIKVLSIGFLSLSIIKPAWSKTMTAEEFLQTLNELTVTNNLSYPDTVAKQLGVDLKKQWTSTDIPNFSSYTICGEECKKEHISTKYEADIKLEENVIVNLKYLSAQTWVIRHNVKGRIFDSGELNFLFPDSICIHTEKLDRIFSSAKKNIAWQMHPVGGGEFYGNNQKGQNYMISYGDNPNSALDILAKVHPVEHCVTGITIIIDGAPLYE